MNQYDVYAMGNALVDLEYSISTDFLKENEIDKGLMTLIEKDRHFELLEKLKESGSDMIKKQCGGSAANTIIALSQFGAKGFYSCKVSNDEMGVFYKADLKSNGVSTNELADSDEPTGKCIVMVTKDADRTMNTFLGVTSNYGSSEIDYDALKSSKWLYVEGYLVASPTAQAAALETIKYAKENGVKIALTMSDPNMVKFFRENMNALIQDQVDLLFCNEDEALEFTGTDKVVNAREVLKKYAKNFVITLGKNGATLWDGTMFIDVEPHIVDAIDSNGAGDMFAGAYLYGINKGHTPAGSATLASMACSKVVTQFGPRLSTETLQGVLKQVFSK